MEIFVLASGSKGNMTYLKVGHIKIFVDAGISYKRIKEKMDAYQEDLYDVKSILITHEHSDHVMGLRLLLKNKIITDVYLTSGTYKALSEDIKIWMSNVHIIQSEDTFDVLGLKVRSFMVSHDASEPVGYVIEHEGKKICFVNDTGYVDQAYYDMLSDADCYLLEANHHPTKLMQSPRPFLLKKRILGERGHLSNDDAAWLINHLVKNKESKWIITHISEDCNSVLDIEESIVKTFDDPTKVEVYYATKEGLDVIKI
ncbi:MAG: MBL fold metallo-hydrolase [Acholeplasmataceae bacterium]|nr:MBL fold metallo-hydrolase [Acholeplasmataceae bacterium]